MICCFKGKFRVTSPYGTRVLNGVAEFHKGIDLVGIDSTTVYSVSDGTVKIACQPNGAGNYIVITMPDGRRVFYMHLESFLVTNGQNVKAGQAIAIMGNTGNSTGAHTHLEIRPKGTTSQSLDITEFTAIPNTKGVYINDSIPVAFTQEQFDDMLNDYLRRQSLLSPDVISKKERLFCESHGIILGDGVGNMQYKSFVTKEQMAQIAYRIITGLTNNFHNNK